MTTFWRFNEDLAATKRSDQPSIYRADTRDGVFHNTDTVSIVPAMYFVRQIFRARRNMVVFWLWPATIIRQSRPCLPIRPIKFLKRRLCRCYIVGWVQNDNGYCPHGTKLGITRQIELGPAGEQLLPEVFVFTPTQVISALATWLAQET